MPTTVTPPGLRLVEHEFSVPLDYADPDGERITVFAREVADPDGLDRPLLLYLQGGPGHEAPRPTPHPSSPGWLERALREFRVLMLDQRGTGRSSPIGTLPGMTAPEQADYLKHFRADSIVRDAECIRHALGSEPWSVLGQSFGGLCAVTYLSYAPEGLREVFVCGGLGPIGARVDGVYRSTYARVKAAGAAYYERYPEDRARVIGLHRSLKRNDVRLPCGDRLTSRRLRQLGAMLGMSSGAEGLHYILEQPFHSPGFLYDVDAQLNVARNPLYVVLHEACWADGKSTQWSAERMLSSYLDLDPELFTGEHVYPWMFDEYSALEPLSEAAVLLSTHHWPRLYDPAQLMRNEIPVATVIYIDDMYVPHEHAEQTASLIRGCHSWVTNELQHDGLRTDGERVLGRLIDMARGRV